MDETHSFPLEFTQEAREALERKLHGRGTPNAYVRFGVKGGGCTGFRYFIEFDDEPTLEKSISRSVGMAKVIVDVKSATLLSGTIVTYTKSFMYEGFGFENPNEASRCSCGKSFTV